MGASVGEIDLDLRVNQSGFNRQLKGIQAMAKNVGAAIASAFAVRVVINFGKTCISTATEVENAWVGLNSIINGQGKSFNNAKKFIQEYISDGLVPLKNAVIAYKNLSLRGYNEEQIQKVMNALKNSATYARQSQYSLGDAISTATEGLKNENSIVVDNAGVTKNVAKMWEDYAKSIGVSYTSLTKEQKIQAEVNGILEETKFQMGDAEKYANTYSGKVAKLSASFTNLKVKIGNILKVIVGAFIPVINNAIKVVEKFIDGITALLNSFGIQTNIVDTLKDVSETAEGSSNNIDGITESAKEAEKAVNRLMGFDEINLLSKDDSSANSDNTNSGDGSVDMSGIADETKETSTVFDGLINKVKKINELLSPTKTALQGLSSELKRLSDFAFDGLKDFYNSFLKPVAVWTIGKGLPRFIDAITNGLAKVNWQKINDSLHTLWVSLAPFAINIGEGLLWFWENVLVPLGTWTLNNAVPAFLDLLSGAIAVLNPILEVFMELGEWLWNEFLQPIASWTGGVIISALEGLASALKDIGEWMSNNKSVIETFTIIIGSFAAVLGLVKLKALAWSAVCKLATPIISALGTAIAFLISPIGLVVLAISGVIAAGILLYKNCKEFREKVQSGAEEFIEKIKTTFEKIKNKIIDPIIIPAIEKMKEVWDKHIKGMLDKATEFVGKLIIGVMDFVNKVIMPIINVLVDVLAPIVVSVFNYLTDSIGTAVAVISDILGGIFEVLGGIIDFLVGVFTGNWKKAWEGVKSIFKGIWDSLVGIVKWPINMIIDMVNALVSAINSIISGINEISIDVPDWIPGIGGEKFGFDIPKIKKIPMLADGGFVKANTPQLAMIGDNKHQGEVVAPENKLSELLDKAVSKSGNSNKVELLLEKLISIVEEGQTVNMNVDGIKLGNAVAKGVNKITKANGGICPIIT